jgi:hypothetical protein
MATGPIVKRGGFEYVRDAAASASWLTLFSFSAAQEYLLEWSDNALRFYTNWARIESNPTTPYVVATPYLGSEASQLSQQQSFDRLYIDHIAHPPAMLSRTSATTFSFGNLTFLNGPFADANNDQTVTIQASAPTGAVTLTANAAVWQPGHVGELFRLDSANFAAWPAWEPAMHIAATGGGVRSDSKMYIAQTTGYTGSVQPTHSSGTAYDGMTAVDINGKGPYGIQWLYESDTWGTVSITSVAADGKSAQGTVVRRLPDDVYSAPTWKWAHGAWSNAAGWPGLVTLWEGRMIHIVGFYLCASVVGDYGGGRANYITTTASGIATSDLAFTRMLATDNPPLWLATDRQLLVGTAHKELAISAVNAAAPISSDNISAKEQSYYGSEPIPAIQIGLATIFVERGSRRIRASNYDFMRDRYAPVDMTVAARHITRPNVVQLARLRYPWPMLYAVRGDGQLIVHSDTLDVMKGFSRFVLGGGAQVLSACAVTGPDARTDDLWVLVQRQRSDGTNLHTVREIWRQHGWRQMGDDPQESFYVDGGTRLTGTPGQTVWNAALPQLISTAVACLVGGAVVADCSVDAGGTLSLPAGSVPSDRAFTVIVGLAYTATAVTLPPEVPLAAGSTQGLLKRARKAMMRFVESLGIKVGGTLAGDPLEEMIERAADQAMDWPIPLMTGVQQALIDAQFERDGQVQVVSSDPLPAIITAAMLSIEVDQRDA